MFSRKPDLVALLSRAAIINSALDSALGNERDQSDVRRLNAIYNRSSGR